MKQSLEKRIILFSFVILFMTSLANTAMDIAVFRKEYILEMLQKADGLGSSLKGNIEKVLALGIDIQDVSGLSEKCKEAIQSEPEMSYCVITRADGKNLFSSDLDFSRLDFSGVRTKSEFSFKGQGKASQLRTSQDSYYDVRIPVTSFDSSVSAIIHIGFPQKVIDQKIQAIIIRAVAVFLLFLVISFALVIFFVKRSIIAPITTLLNGVTRITRGELTTPIQALSTVELDQLGVNINSMAQSIETRDRQLQKNYGELSDTHSRLHESFLAMEKVRLELEKSEQLYKKLQEEAGDAIIILDATETVIISNRMAEEFLDVADRKVTGQHISSLLLQIRAENIPYLLKIFKEAYSQPNTNDDIVFSNRRDERLIGKMHISGINVDDNALLQIIIRDVTREKEILSNLESSAAGLARLNRMKDSFLGMASHELKTPLTVILGYSELLLTEMKDKLLGSSVEMVQNISAAAARLDNIVKDMVDVSVIDQKRIQLKLVPVDINALIDSSIRELNYFFALRKQSITTKLDDTLPVIHGDQTRLTQLLSNILVNAIKFTPDGGTIKVETSLKTVEWELTLPGLEATGHLNICKEQKQVIEIVITDNGIGISLEDQQNIFDKFYEAGNIEEHSSGKVAFKSRGAGLGLSISKGFVEMHGGRIWVASEGYDPLALPGSSFFIHLPLDLDQSSATVAKM
jgi:PAS domain S-box-containing protein